MFSNQPRSLYQSTRKSKLRKRINSEKKMKRKVELTITTITITWYNWTSKDRFSYIDICLKEKKKRKTMLHSLLCYMAGRTKQNHESLLLCQTINSNTEF